jgi:heterodisulfide reductase subunit A-like polyferredoxin
MGPEGGFQAIIVGGGPTGLALAIELGDTRIYMGLIHSMDSFAERYAAAKRFLPDFGLAGYCGFGRLNPDQIDGALSDHLRAVEIARECVPA